MVGSGFVSPRVIRPLAVAACTMLATLLIGAFSPKAAFAGHYEVTASLVIMLNPAPNCVCDGTSWACWDKDEDPTLMDINQGVTLTAEWVPDNPSDTEPTSGTITIEVDVSASSLDTFDPYGVGHVQDGFSDSTTYSNSSVTQYATFGTHYININVNGHGTYTQTFYQEAYISNSYGGLQAQVDGEVVGWSYAP